jgi:HEPN domain-containing protein
MKYISTTFIKELNKLDSPYSEKFISIIKNINKAYCSGRYEDCYINIRGLTEFIASLYEVREIASVTKSKYWDRTAHLDLG